MAGVAVKSVLIAAFLCGQCALAEDQHLSSVALARRAYVVCVIKHVATFIPYASNLDRLIFTSFLFCAGQRITLVTSLSENGYKDAEGIATSIDEKIVDELVPAHPLPKD